MPQFLVLMLAGAGAIAGARWAARQLDRMAAEARRVAEEAERQAQAARSSAARNLGTLEYDAATGQYRPKSS
ncbi:MAG: hypothetical protein AB7U75_15485 [Hyphomicrobiaceae bacterium]